MLNYNTGWLPSIKTLNHFPISIHLTTKSLSCKPFETIVWIYKYAPTTISDAHFANKTQFCLLKLYIIYTVTNIYLRLNMCTVRTQ